MPDAGTTAVVRQLPPGSSVRLASSILVPVKSGCWMPHRIFRISFVFCKIFPEIPPVGSTEYSSRMRTSDITRD